MHRALYLDEVQAGQRWKSPARTVTEADVVAFAGLTGDYNPLHMDHEFARQSPFRRPIAHGLLGLTWVAGLGAYSPWMQTAALVRVLEWNFVRPVFIGDTLHVVTELLAKRSRGRRRGIAVWKRQLVNQAQEVVQEGSFETLVLLSAAHPPRGRGARGGAALAEGDPPLAVQPTGSLPPARSRPE